MFGRRSFIRLHLARAAHVLVLATRRPAATLLATLVAVACHDTGSPVRPGVIEPPSFSHGGLHPGVWTTMAPMPTARMMLAVGVVRDTLYAVGGCCTDLRTVEAYNPATNSWTGAPNWAPMPTGRSELAVGVVNGILYAVGGRNSGLGALQTVEAYNPATNTWTPKAPMPTARYNLAVGVVNGILYAVGGNDGNGARLQTVEAYNPATNTWTGAPNVAQMPTARTVLAAGVVNGMLYAVGGSSSAGAPLPTVEAYNPATNTWTPKAPMPTARQSLAVGVSNGLLYAVGGWASVSRTAKVEAYNPATNTWTTIASMSIARQYLAVGVANGILYAVGGDGEGAVRLATVEAYAPPVLAGAGDIGARTSTGSCATGDEATALLLDDVPIVFTAGDNAYEDGRQLDYQACYDPSWGRHKWRTYAALGDHEYGRLENLPADPTWDYFGVGAGPPTAGPRGKGWYSFNVGAWHVVVLNSNCTKVECHDSSSTKPVRSEQVQWLIDDLAANTMQCTLAIWHNPRFRQDANFGYYNGNVKPFWNRLHNAGAEVVVNGNWHLYERYAPQDPEGRLDTPLGIVQFTVGTGGATLKTLDPGATAPNLEVWNNTTRGILKLTLNPTSYAWEFVPVAGGTFTDSGTAQCH